MVVAVVAVAIVVETHLSVHNSYDNIDTDTILKSEYPKNESKKRGGGWQSATVVPNERSRYCKRTTKRK